MKDISQELTGLLTSGYCTPLISQIARKTKHPSSTIHYNIKRLEENGTIAGYKAVFDKKKLGLGFSTIVLLNLSTTEYGNPERIAKELAAHKEIESVDICTGDWEIALYVRTTDMDAYYELIKNVISRPGITKIKTLSSLKQVKNEGITN